MITLRKHKPTIQLLAAIATIALGYGLIIAGFILPPLGEILTFAGALFGIDYHYKYSRPKDRDEDISP